MKKGRKHKHVCETPTGLSFPFAVVIICIVLTIHPQQMWIDNLFFFPHEAQCNHKIPIPFNVMTHCRSVFYSNPSTNSATKQMVNATANVSRESYEQIAGWGEWPMAGECQLAIQRDQQINMRICDKTIHK